MRIQKRSGAWEAFSFDKITARIKKQCYTLKGIEAQSITMAVVQQIKDLKNINTSLLDHLIVEHCYHEQLLNPDYSVLAHRIELDVLYKNTKKSFSEVCVLLQSNIRPETGKPDPKLDPECFDFIMKHKEQLDEKIVHSRDLNHDLFGLRTLTKSYLLRVNDKVAERPQHMWMRVSVGIHRPHLEDVLTCYELLSTGKFTHATPTLFHSGTPRPDLSSCFLLRTKADSIDGIFETVTQCAKISQASGGIGCAISNIRASDTAISGNGRSSGIVPMLGVFDKTASYVDQRGLRPGSFAMYLEPWHPNVESFLELKKNTGAHDLRTPSLFFGLWIPNLFMKRVENDEMWTLMCPHQCPGLWNSHSEDFETLYLKYEKEKRGRKSIPARDLWKLIQDSVFETGTPYLMFKDSCNSKSNQQHLGTITSSNLCAEIVQYNDENEIAVCNLASISLPAFVVVDAKTKKPHFHFDALFETVKFVTKSIDRVINRTRYPLPQCRVSNERHRPMAIGIQGLSDAFDEMRFPYESLEAKTLNREILETMYFAALTSSTELARVYGQHASFLGSPASKGILQYDMWNVAPSSRWDWASLKATIAKQGLRNSLLIGLMPTASTSQILGNTESFEVPQHNYMVRKTQTGDFIVTRKRMIRDLIALGLWTPEFREKFVQQKGSIQNMLHIPEELRKLYKTSEEVSMKSQLDMSLDRAPFVDQTQSLNIRLSIKEGSTLPDWQEKHRQVIFYLWKRGAKTGSYYTRLIPVNSAYQFTVDKKMVEAFDKKQQASSVVDKTQANSVVDKTQANSVVDKMQLVVSLIVNDNEEHKTKEREQESDDKLLTEMFAKMNAGTDDKPACDSCGS